MVYTYQTTKLSFDAQMDDILWTTADCGWITGHSYLVYGPLLNGLTSIIFEGIPSYPDSSRMWQIVEKYKVQYLFKYFIVLDYKIIHCAYCSSGFNGLFG